MKEYPIIFNTEMVQAILDGSKTQTRRVMKPQPKHLPVSWGCVGGKGFGFFDAEWNPVKCPYGQVGDSRLWVRETWYCATDKKTLLGYKADGDYPHDCFYMIRPSIHMPRKYSRITLEITDIRVERVQDITEDDADAEGVPILEPDDFPVAGATYGISRQRFVHLWDSINAKRGYGWYVNPWVWVIEFKEIEK